MKKIDLKKLLELAGDNAVSLELELYRFSKLLAANFELLDFLSDARQSPEVKKRVIVDAAKKPSKLLTEVLSLLVDQGICRELPELSWEFTRLVAEKEKVRYDELVFSEKPSDETLLKFERITGGKVKFRIEIDPEIMGGFIWKTMDGREMDASIAARLSQVKEEIKA